MFMKSMIMYSFDDEPVSKFCYDLDNNILEIYFNGYFDMKDNKYKDKTCVWTIENWKEARIKIGDDSKFYDLTKCLGIFTLILYMKYDEEGLLELLVHTVDDRYITLFFKEPILNFKVTD